MAVLTLGGGFQAVVNQVCAGITKDNVGANTFNITAAFVSKNNADVRTLSREIDSITFTQDFIHNYRDKIIVEMTVPTANYRWFFINRAELFCKLSFTRVCMSDGSPRMGEAMFERDYKCILITNADPDKVVPASMDESDKPTLDRNQTTYKIKVELISQLVYTARKKRLSGILRGDWSKDKGVNIDSIIYYTIAHFGFSKAFVVPPDNTTKYVNFVIPPTFTIEDIMQFYQNSPGHGVYSNGLCSYIQDDIWYVYSRYGEYISFNPVHLYRVAPGMYAGVNKYDWVQPLARGDTATHILLMDSVEERNLSFIGYENNPNSINIQSSGAIVDGCRTVLKDGLFRVNPRVDNYRFVCNRFDVPSIEDDLNIEFVYSHNNKFAEQTRTVALNQTRIQFKLNMATPYIFGPGRVVKYIYEHKSGDKLVIRSMTGAAEMVTTTFTRDTSSRTYPVFAGTADVVISCNNALARDDGII